MARKIFAYLSLILMFHAEIATAAVQNTQVVQDAALPTLGKAARTNNESIITSIDNDLNSPIRIYATTPTADSKLNFGPNKVESGDGAQEVSPPADDVINTFPASTIDYQTGSTTGGTIQVDGGTFALPTCTVGQYRRHVFKYVSSDNKIDSKFTAEVASEGSLENPGTTLAVLSGLPVGYIELECTNASPGRYKTIGSATAIIQNKVSSTGRIYRFGSGSGVGGSVTDFKIQSVASDGTTVIKGGYIKDDVSNEYATYDGSGSAETDYGKDLTIDLDVLEPSPVNSTTYYLYIDKTTLSASVTTSDTGRVLFAVQQANLDLLTTSPANTLLSRYIPLGLVRRATGAWSTTIFKTLAFRTHVDGRIAINPVEYELTSTVTALGASTGTITHSKNIPVAHQEWIATVALNSGAFLQLDNGWITDKTANAVNYDFSGLVGADTVTIKLRNTAITANSVPVASFDTGELSAAPSFPIAHGLGGVPTSVLLQHEGEAASGVWTNLPVSDYCYTDATNITCVLTGLTIDSTHRIRLVASRAVIAVAVDTATATKVGIVSLTDQTLGEGQKQLNKGLVTPNASTSSTTVASGVFMTHPGLSVASGHTYTVNGTLVVPGTVTGLGTGLGTGTAVDDLNAGLKITTGTQIFSGNKTFTGVIAAPTARLDAIVDNTGIGAPVLTKGSIVTGTTSSPSGNQTLTVVDSAIQYMNPSVDIDLTLNNSHKAGRVVTIVNQSTTKIITLKANDASVIRTVYPLTTGQVVAASDFPTATASWYGIGQVTSGWLTGSTTGIETRGSSNGQVCTNMTYSLPSYRRIGDTVHFKFRIDFTGLPGTCTGSFNTKLPTAFTVDTAKVTSSDNTPLGVTLSRISTTNYSGVLIYAGTSGGQSIIAYMGGNATFWAPTIPASQANGDYITVEVMAPISGWADTKG